MTDMKIRNIRSGSFEQVKPVQLLVGGFSCVSKSPCSNLRGQNKKCLSDAENSGQTAKTYAHMKNIIRKFSPECVIAENLIDLIGDGEADSDASVVIGDFAKMQYQADKHIVSSVEYGSLTIKKRLRTQGKRRRHMRT